MASAQRFSSWGSRRRARCDRPSARCFSGSARTLRRSLVLVEQFDSDGRRFLLAHKNPENVIDPRGLTDMESRVTGLAVRGYSNKLIAYHLGISEGTVGSHLHRAMRKLNIPNRVELVRALGTHYPQQTDPRFAT